MKHRALPRIKPLLLSLLLVVLILVPVSFLAKPHVIRWYTLRQLTDRDLARRERALNYVLRRGRVDPRVVDGTIARLGVEDPENFLQIVNVLDRLHKWRRPPVPEQPWLRWLEALAGEELPEARIVTAKRLADLSDLAADPRVVKLLHRLMNDTDDDVRYNALVAAAELSGHAGAGAAMIPILKLGAADRAPEVARQAWIFLGLLGAADGLDADWKQAPPRAAEAMTWALARCAPDKIEAMTQALIAPETSPALRASLAYALATRDGQPESAFSSQVLAPLLALPRDEATLAVWRLVLAMPPESADSREPVTGNRIRTRYEFSFDALPPPFALAVIHHMAPWLMAHRDDAVWKSPAAKLPLTLLAIFEGLPPGVFDATLPENPPDLLRIAATDAAKHPDPAMIRPLFGENEATLRDLAVVVAAERFTKEQNTALIPELLGDFNDQAKMSGAVLSGLCKLEPDLLTRKMTDEDVWPVKELMKMGLWMQGRLPEMTSVADGLLIRTDIPKTTLLLTLIHDKHPIGLDYLFNPRGEPPLNLLELLDEKRWWRVLRGQLPEDAPPFWVWADPGLEHFQIDVLRNWYLLKRADYAKGSASSTTRSAEGLPEITRTGTGGSASINRLP